jgi:hypothetical protein
MLNISAFCARGTDGRRVNGHVGTARESLHEKPKG